MGRARAAPQLFRLHCLTTYYSICDYSQGTCGKFVAATGLLFADPPVLRLDKRHPQGRSPRSSNKLAHVGIRLLDCRLPDPVGLFFKAILVSHNRLGHARSRPGGCPSDNLVERQPTVAKAAFVVDKLLARVSFFEALSGHSNTPYLHRCIRLDEYARARESFEAIRSTRNPSQCFYLRNRVLYWQVVNAVALGVAALKRGGYGPGEVFGCCFL